MEITAERARTSSTNPTYGKDHRHIDLIDLLLVLSRNKKTILGVTLVAALLAGVVVWVLPNMYTATTTILPPQPNQSSASLLMGQIGLLGGLSTNDLGLKNSADLFTAMLRSRSIQDGIIDKFNLRGLYRVKRYEDARRKLNSRRNIVAGDDGLISISVTDPNPKRAADMANAYVDQLLSLNQSLAFSEAAQRRLFYQQKLNDEREQLSQAELALKQAQEKSGLIQPDAQDRAIIDAVVNARAQVSMKEVQLQAMRSYATPNNPDLKRSEQELAGMRAQLARLEQSTGELGKGNLEIPTRRLPEAQLAFVRLSRDLKYHEALFEFLSKQLEAAEIDEAKEALVVQVVDKAVVPETKSGPRRLLIVLVATFVVLGLACFAVLLKEAFAKKVQDPDYASRLEGLRSSLRVSNYS